MPEGRSHKMAGGWARQGMQIPEDMARAFTAEADRYGPNSVKLLGTLAVGILLGMPQAERDELLVWLTRRLWEKDPVAPAEVWARMAGEAVTSDAGKPSPTRPITAAIPPVGDTHRVDRIADPRITLPAGQRPGERKPRATGA